MLAANLQPALPSRLLGPANTLVPAILFQAIQLEVTSGFASKAWQPPGVTFLWMARLSSRESAWEIII